MAVEEDALDAEAASFDPDALYDDALSELEERHKLARTVGLAAAVAVDLQDKGPLYLYVQARRRQALADLTHLMEVDPKDGIAVAAAQASIREYLNACVWIATRIEDAKEADKMIQEHYGNRTDDEPSSDHPD